MMKLYQEHKVNPLASCLPLLLQIPVFIIMFRVLHGLTNTRSRRARLHAAVHPQDAVAAVPVAGRQDGDAVVGPRPVEAAVRDARRVFWPGFVYALLVVALGVLYFVQQRMVAARATVAPTMSPTQQKLMQYLPVVFAVFLFFYLTGLVIYYMAQAIFRIGLQYYITRRFYHGEESLGRQARPPATEAREIAKKDGGGGGGLFANAKRELGAGKAQPAPAKNGKAGPSGERCRGGAGSGEQQAGHTAEGQADHRRARRPTGEPVAPVAPARRRSRTRRWNGWRLRHVRRGGQGPGPRSARRGRGRRRVDVLDEPKAGLFGRCVARRGFVLGCGRPRRARRSTAASGERAQIGRRRRRAEPTGDRRTPRPQSAKRAGGGQRPEQGASATTGGRRTDTAARRRSTGVSAAGRREARKFIEELVAAFGLQRRDRRSIEDGDDLEVPWHGDDLGLLVGPKGATLQAVQDLARVASQRRLGDHSTRLRVDVGGYRERRGGTRPVRTQVADEVKRSGTARALEPMSSADRKIVHEALLRGRRRHHPVRGRGSRPACRHRAGRRLTGSPTTRAASEPPSDDDTRLLRVLADIQARGAIGERSLAGRHRSRRAVRRADPAGCRGRRPRLRRRAARPGDRRAPARCAADAGRATDQPGRSVAPCGARPRCRTAYGGGRRRRPRGGRDRPAFRGGDGPELRGSGAARPGGCAAVHAGWGRAGQRAAGGPSTTRRGGAQPCSTPPAGRTRGRTTEFGNFVVVDAMFHVEHLPVPERRMFHVEHPPSRRAGSLR